MITYDAHFTNYVYKKIDFDMQYFDSSSINDEFYLW